MTMMFEVQDLAVASPATVSRCGMVYLEPSILGLKPFTECWLRTIPPPLRPYAQELDSLFTRFLQVRKTDTSHRYRAARAPCSYISFSWRLKRDGEREKERTSE